MNHLIRDILISFFQYSGISYWYRLRQSKQGPLVRVLCFHDVADPKWFSGVIGLLNDRYHVVTPGQFYSHEFVDDKINILLTFDDGYKTWIDNCLPELEKFAFKGLFFVNSGLLDCAEDKTLRDEFYRSKLLISPKEPLTWEGVRRLKAAGHQIGGHTINHVRMSQVSAEEVTREVVTDKHRHEEMLNKTLVAFAYPFGTKKDYTKETMKQVGEAGYQYQFSAVSGFTQISDISVLIPRTLIENNQSLLSIKSWIEGGYDVFNKLIRR